MRLLVSHQSIMSTPANLKKLLSIQCEDKAMMIESSMLREVWAVVEKMPTPDLLALSDTALIAMLMKHVSQRVSLNAEEVNDLYAYIGTKLVLIRDIASFR